MRRFATFLAAAVVVAVGAAGSTPALAQSPNCVDIYRHVMELYQVAPQSLEYNQVATVYSATCLAGPATAAGYPAYNSQYSDEYQPSYGYAEPAYPYYGGYGSAVPVGVGIGLGFVRGFHHDGGFHGGDFHDHGGFHGAVFRSGEGPHGDGGHGNGRHGDGDYHDHH